MPGPRTLSVDARRIERWAGGFRERHGSVEAAADADAVTLTAADGATAVLHVPYQPWAVPDPASGPDVVAALAAHAQAARRVPVLLVRRGGYAVAVVEDGTVAASKVGSRYVQGRTAAGGWSQQRFARRREGQTQALLDAVAQVAGRVVVPLAGDALATGGDRTLVDRLLADQRLRPLAALPRGPHLDVGDPKSDDVKALPAALRQIKITLTEPVP
jgi:hypothetical protein